MADFPVNGIKEDSRFFNTDQEDPAMKSKMEGGYQLSRPRFTRAPRKTFQTGFTDIGNEEKEALDAFYAAMRGGSQSFTWHHPTENHDYVVRFEGKMKFKYVGQGGNHRWNSEPITLVEV